MSIKVQLEVSWEEMRALNQAICLAKDQLQDLEENDPLDESAGDDDQQLAVMRSVAARNVSLAEAYLAGVKGALLDKIQELQPGDHLRDHYWPFIFEVAGEQPSGES